MEEYAAAKAMLFEGLGKNAVALVNADDKWAGRMVDGCRAKVVRYHVEFDLKEGNPLRVAERPPDGWSGLVIRMGCEEMWVNIAGPEVYVRNLGRAVPYLMQQTTPLVGKHNAYNLTSVYAAAWSLGFRAEELLEGWRVLLRYKGAPGRLQRVETAGTGFSVFVDYAHTHDALENVLTALRATMGRPPKGGTPNGAPNGSPNGRLICLFGCGGDRDRTKRPKMGAVAERLADVVIVTSDNPRTEEPAVIIEEICAGFSPAWKTAGKITIEPDRRAAIHRAIAMAKPGDVVLLAGKGHENYQIIGTTKHHFDDVEEAENALRDKLVNHEGTKLRREIT
jgi:UDP-N-acetylmuramoyl-L-alanyl-D-glutamate--2,6-diaminopimelate ligase